MEVLCLLALKATYFRALFAASARAITEVTSQGARFAPTVATGFFALRFDKNQERRDYPLKMSTELCAEEMESTQSSPKKFHRILCNDPSSLPDSALPASLPTWRIEYNGESCELSDMLGCRYLHTILDGGNPAVPEYVPVAIDRRACVVGGLQPESFGGSTRVENFGAVTNRELNDAITEAQGRERVARLTGGKTLKDVLDEIKILRRYQRETIGLGGKRRKFPAGSGSANKAIASAIYRAIEAIRKRCPGAARYLDEHVKRNNSGEWTFVGTEKWELEIGPEPDESVLSELTLEDFQDESDAEIRPTVEYVRHYYTEHGRTIQYEEGISIEPEEQAEELRRKWLSDAARTKRSVQASIFQSGSIALRKSASVDPWWFPKQKH
jgi:hypothetical protein